MEILIESFNDFRKTHSCLDYKISEKIFNDLAATLFIEIDILAYVDKSVEYIINHSFLVFLILDERFL